MKRDEGLLREILEEHARNPYGVAILENVSDAVEWKSPKTGNLCRVQITTQNNLLLRLVAQVEGSALAKACASIMCYELEGETLERVQSIQQDLQHWVEDQIPPHQWKGDLAVYQSLVQFPERMDCAMLCWRSFGLVRFD